MGGDGGRRRLELGSGLGRRRGHSGPGARRFLQSGGDLHAACPAEMGSCEADGGCSAEATAALAGDGSPSPGSDLFNAVVMCMMNLEDCGSEKYACWVDSACSSVREMPTDTDAEKEAWQAAADGLSDASRAALDAVGNCECSFDPCCGCHAGCPEGDGGCHEACDALCTGAAVTNANGGSCRLREEFRHAEDCADIVGTPQMPSPCS